MMTQSMKSALLTCILSFCLVAPGLADAAEDALDAYYRGDYSTAEALFREAAEQGDAGSQFALGTMYDTGRGLPQDFAKAIKWYRKAAERGEGLAQLRLGVMYEKGVGIAQDLVMAHKWLHLAATGGRDQSGLVAQARDRIGSKLTPDQLAEAQRLAREWKPKK